MEQEYTYNPKMAIGHAASLLEISTQAVHKYLKKNNIILPRIGNKSYICNKTASSIFHLNFKKKKIAFHIVKGGTGKTTAIHNITCCASTYGARILVIDLDPQGNLTDTFNFNAEHTPVMIDIISGQATVADAVVNVSPGIDLIPSRIENVVLDNKLAIERKPLHTLFKQLLKSIESNYDFIFIDCPPTMGHSVTAASLYAGLILTPLNPDKYSAKGLQILKEEIVSINEEFGTELDYKVFLNKFSGNTILSDKAISTTISEETANGKALSTAVRQSQEIPNAVDDEINLFSHLKKSTARDDFDLLTRELLDINALEQKIARLKQQELDITA